MRIWTAPLSELRLRRITSCSEPKTNSPETLVEEDNWVVASEWADSLGVDVINTSFWLHHLRQRHWRPQLCGFGWPNSRHFNGSHGSGPNGYDRCSGRRQRRSVQLEVHFVPGRCRLHLVYRRGGQHGFARSLSPAKVLRRTVRIKPDLGARGVSATLMNWSGQVGTGEWNELCVAHHLWRHGLSAAGGEGQSKHLRHSGHPHGGS